MVLPRRLIQGLVGREWEAVCRRWSAAFHTVGPVVNGSRGPVPSEARRVGYELEKRDGSIFRVDSRGEWPKAVESVLKLRKILLDRILPIAVGK